ncbi:hypothetical protein [Dulcicalothrix desertica]|uniref:hypothetical protein n=1 Tax=Dulcicalothrix desertica TaxID=32056 RepID=UPI0013151179|nr:hypothetical protein [Dulcicalothrix desertica]
MKLNQYSGALQQVEQRLMYNGNWGICFALLATLKKFMQQHERIKQLHQQHLSSLQKTNYYRLPQSEEIYQCQI